MPSAKNSAASVGMMTLPIQFVRFVMPVKKFIMPRESHHRNDKLPNSGHREKGARAGDKPDRRTSESEVDDRADHRQAGCYWHDPARRIGPGALKHRGGSESSAIVPGLKQCGGGRNGQKKHRAENRRQRRVSLAEV